MEVEAAQFPGLFSVSGYRHLPDGDSYWSANEDLDVPIFRNDMSRKKFRSIK